MRHSRSAFTLIEILVASTIGVLMLSLVTGALIGIKHVSEKNQKLASMHEEAATINRLVLTDAGAMCHNAKCEGNALPGADGLWGTGDEVLTFTWMTAISNPEQLTYGFGRDPKGDLTWCRLRWIGGGPNDPSRLMFTRNNGYRNASAASVDYFMDPILRRDRQRDLDDNDLRFVPGLSPATYSAIGMKGDSQDLDIELAQVHSPKVSVEDVEIAWVDRGGWRMVMDGTSGISQFNPNGTAIPLLGGPWENTQRIGVDGLFLDARPLTLPTTSRPISDTRPVLLQLSFTLLEYSDKELGIREPVSLRMSFSFPTNQDLSLP